MWRVFYGSRVIGDSRVPELALLDKKLELSLNQTGTFSFTVPPFNEGAGQLVLYQKTDEVSVEQDGECLFRGRVMSAETSFDGSVEYWCEGDRGYLNDAVVQPYATGEDGVPTSAFGFFTWLVNQYNDSMNAVHRFTIGINQGDQLGSVDRQSSGRSTVWAEMKAAIVDQLGGYVRTRHENGMRFIDLLASGDDVAEQRIRFGENLMDYSRKRGGSDYCTRVFATGGTPEKENRDQPDNDPVDLVPLGSRELRDGCVLRSGWVIDTKAEDSLGVIEAAHEFEGVLSRDKLLDDAVRWLLNVKIGDTIEMTALDLSNVDPEARPIRVGDYVRATSRPHGFDEYFICTSRTYDLDRPENDKFTLGSEYDTLTDAQAAKLRELNGSINTYVDYLGDVKDLADSKAEVFLTQPTKYNQGDLWVIAPQDGTANKNILVAVEGSTGGYTPTNWTRASDYTNNDAAAQAQAYAEGVASDLAELEGGASMNVAELEQALDDAAAAFDEDAADFAAAAASMKSLAEGAQAEAERSVNILYDLESDLSDEDKAIAQALAQTATNAANAASAVAEAATGHASLAARIAADEQDTANAQAAADNARSYVEGVASTLNNVRAAYAESTTAASTVAKTATITPDDAEWTLTTGKVVIVHFKNALNANSPTLNVNSTGAKPINDVDGNALSKTGEAAWKAGEVVPFVYDGTAWVAKASAFQLAANTKFEQTDEAITLTADKALVNSGRNISPFFEADWPTEGTSTDYWATLTTDYLKDKYSGKRLTDGWARVVMDNREGAETMYAYFTPNYDTAIPRTGTLTMLVEIKLLTKIGDDLATVYANPATTSTSIPAFGAAGSDQISSNGEIRRQLNPTTHDNPNRLVRTRFAIAAGSYAAFRARVSVFQDITDSNGQRVAYTGPWKPYSGSLVYSTHAEITVAADEIKSEVYEHYEGGSGTAGVLDSYSTISQTAEDISNSVKATYKSQYGNCTTEASTAAKVVTCDAFPSTLTKGMTVSVRFANGNEAASPTLNVNGTGAKPVLVNGSSTPTAAKCAWSAYATCTFTYDGSYWRFTGSDEDTKTLVNYGSRITTAETNIDQSATSITSLAAMNDTYTSPDGSTVTNTIKSTVTQTAAAIETRFHDFLASGENMLLDTDVNTYNAVNADYPRGHDTGVTTSFYTMSDPPVSGLRYAHRWQIESTDSQTWQNYSFYNRISGQEQHGFRLTAGQKYTMGCWVRGGFSNQAKARLYLYSNTDDGAASGATCISYEFDVKTGWNFVRASGECPETRNYRAIFSVKPQGNALYVQMCGFTLVEGVPSGEYDTLIRESSLGVEVGKVDDSGDYVGPHALMSSLGAFEVLDTNTTNNSMSRFAGTYARIGKTNQYHVVAGADGNVSGIFLKDGSGNVWSQLTNSVMTIGRVASGQKHLTASSSGIYLYDGTESDANRIAAFDGSSATIGKAGDYHSTFASTGFDIYNGNGVSLGQFTTSGMRIGKEDNAHIVCGTKGGVAGIHLCGYISGTEYENATITSAQITLGRLDHGHLVTNSSGLYVYDEASTAKAMFTSSGAQLGADFGKNVLVTSTGVQLRDYVSGASVVTGQFASSGVQIGVANSDHMKLTSTGVAWYKGGFGTTTEGASNRFLYLTTGSQNVTEGGTTYTYANSALRVGCRYRAKYNGDSFVEYTDDGPNVQMAISSSEPMLLMKIGDTAYTTISATKARIGRHANGYYNIVVDASTNGAGLFLNKSTGTGATSFTTLASFTDSAITMGKADGRNVAITSSAVDICNGSTVLSTFQNNLIELGKNSSAAAIKMCNDSVRISSNSTYGMAVLAPDSGIALQAKKESFVSEIKPEALLFLNPGSTSKAQLKAHNESTQTYAEIVLEASNTKSSITIGTGVFGETPRRGELADWVVDDYTSTSENYGTTANTSTVHWRKWASGRLECERTWFGSRTVQTTYTPATGVTFYTTASAQQTFNWGDTQGNTDSYYGFVTIDSFTVDVRPADGTGLVWSEVSDWSTTNSRNHISGGKAYIFSLYSIAAKNYYVTQKIVGWWK